MLASDWDEQKQKLPAMMQPKVDGVRGMNLGDGLTGRSLKAHANVHTTNFFSMSAFRYFDGEMAAESETNPALCRLTTSALNTIEGEPWIMWWIFDYLHPDVVSLPYEKRYHALKLRYWEIYQSAPELAAHLRVMPCEWVHDVVKLQELRVLHTEAGFEGSILRDPNGMYKHGRSTVREGGLLRIKDFVEEEAVVYAIQQGQQNGNEAKINALGHTERSTHKANMIPNGMVGALLCKCLKTGADITVAAGSMPHDLRKRYFEQQDLIVGKTIKYKTFLKGVKNKPRFPTFQSIRAESDMS
jgi:DNA ligase-1